MIEVYQLDSNEIAGLKEFEDFTIKCSLSIVVNDLVGLLLNQLDGREALNFDVFKLIGGGVHLADDDALVILTKSMKTSIKRHWSEMRFTLYFSPSFSQTGVSCLQCPHQGA